MTINYKTSGVCSQQIQIEVDDSKIVRKVDFLGGCNGNLKGISSLVIGMKVEDVIAKLEGTTCGPRATSCPDQLANALRKAI